MWNCYKGNLLPHKYKADFIIDDKIVLELKAIECLNSSHVKQTLNYLAVSKLKLGLLINFGEESLKYKRIVL
nr:GxxExxY protein [Bizionia arctica]